jgi:ERCC4-related helicase
MPHETLKKIIPRTYQNEIYQTCKEKNCLVVLPTGIGKTLIALMLTVYRQKQFPATKTLFLAPTRPLAEQHLEYFQKHLPELFAEMTLFTGKINAEKRKKLWQSADIIFSTPQCVANDLKKRLYDLSDVTLLIEDECHRCLKNYAYTHVVKQYKVQSLNQRILGMTASPGTDQKTIKQIAENLDIKAIELRTRESEDVKPYLQELEFKKIYLEFPDEFKTIQVLLKAIYDRKISELKKRRLLFGFPSKKTLLETQSRVMMQISRGNKNFNLLLGVSACAQALKVQHAIELLETQTLYSLYEYFQTLFEQARLKQSKAVQKLITQTEFNAAHIKLNELLAKKIEHPKLLQAKDFIETQIKNNPKAKIMIFSQYRSTVARLCKEFNTVPNIKSKVFIGQAKKVNKKGEETGLSQKEQKQIINEFREGKINVLCATSIAEEGLDIPEVSAVIFYEPIPSAIRKIQRAGRTARLMKGKLIMLITKNTRDEIYYFASLGKEKKMYKTIKAMKDQLDKNQKITPANTINKKQDTNDQERKQENSNKTLSQQINPQKTLF